MTADYACPDCDGRLRPRVRRLMYECERCREIVIEVADATRVVRA
jgi:ribosomal protein L37AE/L43A